jgi:hypothetical protein
MNAEDTPWKDAHLVELAELLTWNKLEELPLSCCSLTSSSSKVTNKGLRALTLVATPQFSKLKSLHLGGHASLSGIGIIADIESDLGYIRHSTLSLLVDRLQTVFSRNYSLSFAIS